MNRPRILLKARPTARQLADRLAPPRPDGLELYLAVDDIADGAMDAAIGRVRDAIAGTETEVRVEAPVRSLGGAFFDMTMDTAENRETLRRVAVFGEAVAARSSCVHLIAPRDPSSIEARDRADGLRASYPLLRYYSSVCIDHGLVPTIENVPPIGQMREGLAMASAIGVWASDFVACADAVPDVRVTFDTSHAGMANAYLTLPIEAIAPSHRHPRAVLRESLDTSVASALSRLGSLVVVAHVSGSREYRGEGLPYGGDDPDLDASVDWLLDRCAALVAEILEPDPDHSPSMRASAAHLAVRRDRRFS